MHDLNNLKTKRCLSFNMQRRNVADTKLFFKSIQTLTVYKVPRVKTMVCSGTLITSMIIFQQYWFYV